MESLKQLIREGELIKTSCYKYSEGVGLDYLSGEEYSKWLSACKIFLSLNCIDDKIKADTIKIIDNAYNNYLSEYEKIIGTLKALESNPRAIGFNEKVKEKIKKIFVSHCSKNKDMCNKFVELIKLIGVTNEQIYYSSYEETGSKYLQDCLDSIEEEFNKNDLLVIFMLSREFYKSDICIAETGATWVLCKNNYIPVILPPYSYSNIKGVVRNTQNGLLLYGQDISTKLEQFKETIEKFLNIEKKVSTTEWDRKKIEFIQYIENETKNIEDMEYNIQDISIINSKIVCKVSVENNTNVRKRLELATIYVVSKDGFEIEEVIDDWSITSIAVKAFENVTFYISIGSVDKIKRNYQIDKVKSNIKIEYYDEA